MEIVALFAENSPIHSLLFTVILVTFFMGKSNTLGMYNPYKKQWIRLLLKGYKNCFYDLLAK